MLLPTLINAQLINEGATVIVENGSSLVVESDVINTSGTIQLMANSNLVLSGDFISEIAASFNADPNSNVKFQGIGDKNIKSGGDAFGILIIDKNPGNNLTLLDPATVKTNLQFAPSNGNKLILQSNDLYLENSTFISNASSTDYIQANGTGMIFKTFESIGTFTYPIGDNNDYSPIEVNATSGTYATNSNIGVNVTNSVHPNKYSEADAFISRYWTLEANNIPSFNATLTGTYVDTDINGVEANIKGTNYNGTDWNFANASSDIALNNVSGNINTNGVDFTGMNFYGRLASLKAYLHGAFDSGILTTSLNTDGLLPLNSPYGTGESVVSIPSVDITDWIKIELRDPSDPSIILKTYSKMLKNNGEIVELDGTSQPRFMDAPISAFIAVRHRNHLGIRTGSTLDLTSTPYLSHDFTTSSSQAYGTNPMIETTAGIWAMWSGNTNANDNVRYRGTDNDVDDILTAILNHPSNGFGNMSFQYQEYSDLDANMNGYVRYRGYNNDVDDILTEILNHPANGFSNKSYRIFEQL